jgi:CheY-like chemotaxis protein
VLIVDDEPQIIKVLKLCLAPRHDITSEQRADAALNRIQAGERFDVILCDLMMPQMTGMDLHAQLLALAPDQAHSMLFMTGGDFTARAREFMAGVPNATIEKPFDLDRLLERVDEAARRRAPADQ